MQVPLPTPEQLAGLPRLAIPAFAARCARRVEHLFAEHWPDAPPFRIQAVTEAVSICEHFAYAPRTESTRLQTEASFAAGKAAGSAEVSQHLVSDLAGSISDGINPPYCSATAAAHAARSAAAATPRESAQAAADCAATVARLRPDLIPALEADFQKLLINARQRDWNYQTPVAPVFFALNTTFDIEQKQDGASIAEVAADIDRQLAEFYARDPERLYKLTRSGFLEVISEKFDARGCDTVLHLRTHNGTHDIVAVRRRDSGVSHLIECKAIPDNLRIDIKPVISMHGTTVKTGNTVGLMVTTGRPTVSATGMFERSQWLLAPEDFSTLLKWLEEREASSLSGLK